MATDEAIHTSRSRLRYLKIGLGVLAALVPFVVQYSYIINAFYHFGAPYFDAGLFAQLIWHNDLLIMTPHPRGDFSYLGVHFSQFLLLVNLLSYCWPGHMVEFFTFFMSCIYASLAVGMYVVLLACVQPKHIISVLFLALLAVAYSFNGVVMQGIWMPHFEYAIPSAILAFLFCLGKKSYFWAVFFFVFILLLREDAGLHLITFLGLLTMLRLYKERSFRAVRTELLFIGCAVIYSLFGLIITAYICRLYGVTESPLQFIYTGTPAYAHLSMHLLFQERLPVIFQEHLYLFTGFLITVIWTLFTRNLYWLIGFAACIPWFIFNWCANYGYTGVLYAYYCFPMVLCFGWPIIAAVWCYGPIIPAARVRQMLILQTLLAVAGLIGWDKDVHTLVFTPDYGARWGGYRAEESPELRESIRMFADRLNTARELGTIMVDDSTMSLTIGSQTQKRGLNLHELNYASPVDTIVYFTHDGIPAEDIVKHVTDDHLTQHYCLTQTRICMFTNRTRSQLGTFSNDLSDAPAPPLH